MARLEGAGQAGSGRPGRPERDGRRHAPGGDPGRIHEGALGKEIVEAYLPLVQDLDADVVTFQMAALDQPELIRLLGSEVLPALKGEPISRPG